MCQALGYTFGMQRHTRYITPPHLCLKRKNSVWLRLVIEQGKIKRITYIVPKELRNPREGFEEDAEF